MKKQVCKLQRPLFGTMEPSVLVYPKGLEWKMFVPMNEREMDALFGEKLKIYAEGWVDDGMFFMGDILEEEAW